jgi:hypothetical protein
LTSVVAEKTGTGSAKSVAQPSDAITPVERAPLGRPPCLNLLALPFLPNLPISLDL